MADSSSMRPKMDCLVRNSELAGAEDPNPRKREEEKMMMIVKC
jgi:hypothetical protein